MFTFLKSSPLAQEHLFGLGTSFHTNFFILMRNAGFSRFHGLLPPHLLSANIRCNYTLVTS